MHSQTSILSFNQLYPKLMFLFLFSFHKKIQVTMWRTIVVSIVVLITATTVSNALFVSWDKNANLTKDDIYISYQRIYVPNKFGRITQAFRNLTSHTLDERCHKGMPLSISWSLNEPYSGVLGPKIGRKLGFAARGIFPSK